MKQNHSEADILSIDMFGHDQCGKYQKNGNNQTQLPCMRSSRGGPDVNNKSN